MGQMILQNNGWLYTEHRACWWPSTITWTNAEQQATRGTDNDQHLQHLILQVLSIRYLPYAADIADTSKHPILRTYRYIKSSFRTEPYLYLVNDQRYRRAISQLRCSSHILNVEKGRYTRPRTPLDERLCNMCNCVDDELHFITACAVNVNERRALYDKLTDKFPEFEHLCDLEKFVFLFTFDDTQMLSWLGKFLYKSFWSKSFQTECL